MNFHSVSDAERALDTLNYSSIKARFGGALQLQSPGVPRFARAVLAASCGANAIQAFARVAGWNLRGRFQSQSRSLGLGFPSLTCVLRYHVKPRHIETTNLRWPR